MRAASKQFTVVPISSHDAERFDALAVLADDLREEVDAQVVAERMRGNWFASPKSCKLSHTFFYANYANRQDIWALEVWLRWLDGAADPLDWKDYPAAPAGSVGYPCHGWPHYLLAHEEGGFVISLPELDLQFAAPSHRADLASVLALQLEVRIQRRPDRSFEATVLTAIRPTQETATAAPPP